jgi:hypothetical protein
MKLLNLLLIIVSLQFFGHSQDAFNIKLYLAKGDSFLIDYHVSSTTDQKIMGLQQTMTGNEEIRFLFTVTDSLSDGSYLVQMTCINYRLNVQTAETIQNYDSDSIDNNSESDYIKLFIGKPIIINLDNRGRILSFDHSNIGIATDSITSGDAISIQNAIHKFGDQIPKTILSAIIFSDDPVKIGETWSSPDTVFLSPFFINQIESQLIEVGERNYIAKQTGIISSDDQKFYKTNRIFISYQLSGNMESTIHTDETNGMFTDVKMILTITGSAGMKYSENSDAEYQWPINIKNDIIMKSKKI